MMNEMTSHRPPSKLSERLRKTQVCVCDDCRDELADEVAALEADLKDAYGLLDAAKSLALKVERAIE